MSLLPVPVLDRPHWRVNMRPEKYNPTLISSPGECVTLIEQTKVSFRGWDYPHLSRRNECRAIGETWFASWTDFDGHKEYWRLYQSGQFLYLFAVREAADPEWRERLENAARAHDIDDCRDIDWSKVPGFFSILNVVYTITEIFEFCSRLCQKGAYAGTAIISIRLNGIKGFLLMADQDRSWHSYCRATQDSLEHSWAVAGDVLIADSAGQALDAIVWFFERFGWLKPSLHVLKEDQRRFISGRA